MTIYLFRDTRRKGRMRFMAMAAAFFLLAITINLSASTLNIAWTSPGDDGNSGQAAFYDVRYATFPLNEGNWNLATHVSGEPSPRPAGQSENMVISNLSPNTTYYVGIKTADESLNWSAISNIAVAATGDDLPPADIVDLDAQSGEEMGDLVLRWTAPGDDGNVGTATSYQIACSTDSASVANWSGATIINNPVQPVPAGQTQTYLISGLLPGEKYWAAVRTYDNEDNMGGSNLASGIAKLDISADADDDDNSLPVEYELSQNYPNPFNPTTNIEYSLAKSTHVNLSIYNMLGQHIATLVDENQGSGKYTAVWDGCDQNRMQVSSGMYLYVLRTNDYSASKKMALVK